MDCTQAQEEFAALLDGELAPEERAAVEGHLSQCSDCLRDLDGLKRVDTIYRQLSNVTAPQGFEDRVREAIRPKPALRFPGLSRPRRPLWPVLAAAAVFVLVVGGVVLQFGLPTADKKMTVASLEQKAAAPAPPSAAEPAPAAKPEIAMDAALPAEAQPEVAIEPPVSLEAPMAQEAMPEAGVENRSNVETLKSKGISAGVEHDRAGLHADATQGAPPAAAPPADRLYTESEAPATSAPPPVTLSAPAMADTVEMAAPTPSAEAVDAPSAVAGNTPAEVAAPAPQSSPSDLAKRLSTSAIGIQSTSPMNEGAPPPEAKEELPKVEEVGKRLFELRDGIWYESGYTDQKTTRLVRGSNELRKLVSAHSDLGKVLELGERIVFKAEDKWYRVDPRAGR